MDDERQSERQSRNYREGQVGASLNHLAERIGEVRADIQNLERMFTESSTKQGGRIGDLERHLFVFDERLKWVLTFGAVAWAVVQGVAFAVFSWWLSA